MQTEKRATITEVAEMAGVSVATVSRVLSGGSASQAARRKVEEAIRALDYAPQTAARKKEADVSRSLALVISDLTNPYYASLCAGGCRSYNYFANHGKLYESPLCPTGREK